MYTFQFCPVCQSELTDQMIDLEPRMACSNPNCSFIHYDNPTPVVAAIVKMGDEVILARNVAWPPHFFGLITGFLEKGESPVEGIIREVKEELNLDCTVEELVGNYPFARMNQVILAYQVEAQGEIVLNEELAEYKRVPISELRPWPYATGEAVAEWLSRRGFNPEPIDLRSLRS